MCRIFEEYGKECAEEGKIEVAENLLKDGSLSIEKIAELSGFPLKKIKDLASKLAIPTMA